MTRLDLGTGSIELRHLRYFLAVAEERSVTRAAARLHMAQSPLSAQVRQLEQRIGAPLFDRGPGGVSLTAAGDALLEAAYAALAALEDGLEGARAVSAGRRGRVRVALSPTVPARPALEAVALVARRAPDVHVHVVRVEDAEGALARGDADVAFVRAPLRDRSLPHARAATEPRVLLVAAGHLLARAQQVRVGDLPPSPVLEPSEGGIGTGRPVRRLEELLARVAAGDALAIVPDGLAGDLPSAIAVVPLADAPPSAIVVAGPGPAASPAAAAYVDAVHAAGRRAHAQLRIAG